jgi:hypothetical protein
MAHKFSSIYGDIAIYKSRNLNLKKWICDLLNYFVTKKKWWYMESDDFTMNFDDLLTRFSKGKYYTYIVDKSWGTPDSIFVQI